MVKTAWRTPQAARPKRAGGVRANAFNAFALPRRRASDQDGQWGYSKFALMLQQKGFLLQEVSLAGTNAIPADCRLLISAGPRTPYGSAELGKLREYLGSGGSLFSLFNFYYHVFVIGQFMIIYTRKNTC